MHHSAEAKQQQGEMNWLLLNLPPPITVVFHHPIFYMEI